MSGGRKTYADRLVVMDMVRRSKSFNIHRHNSSHTGGFSITGDNNAHLYNLCTWTYGCGNSQMRDREK